MPLVVTKVDKNGRVFIPAEYRRELGLKPGDRVVVELCDEELRIVPQRGGAFGECKETHRALRL